MREVAAMAAMNGARARLVGAFVSLGAAAFWAGCGSGSKGTSFAPLDGGTSGADGSSSGGGGDAAQSGDAHGLFGDGATGDAAPGCTTCSADLHEILDCDTPPHVLSTCPAAQGCGTNGQCVAPCDAAVAN
ncbi:MAG TPA: hypothetical protein VIY73_04120, partial [Polyangiaceae bacterium]